MLPAAETRKTVKLHKCLQHKLTGYALAAGAAGVSLLALAPHSEAQIFYTPVHAWINQNFPIDLNHDGIPDFHVTSYYFSGIGELAVYPLVEGNRIVATPQSCKSEPYNAAALPKGAVIGPSLHLDAKANCMAFREGSFSTASSGAWLHATDRYLGLSFVIHGREHFGWARLSMRTFIFEHTGMITGYAYETQPNTPIRAGDTGKSEEDTVPSGEPSALPMQRATPSATLGALALGAGGSPLWRRP